MSSDIPLSFSHLLAQAGYSSKRPTADLKVQNPVSQSPFHLPQISPIADILNHGSPTATQHSRHTVHVFE